MTSHRRRHASRSRRRCCSRPMPAASSPWRKAPRIPRSTGSSRSSAASCRSTSVHVPRRLARTIRQGGFEVRIDSDFEGVHRRLRRPARRPAHAPGSTREIRGLYRELFAMRLLPHGRGVAGRRSWSAGSTACSSAGAFFGESMFSTARDASKIALVYLVRAARSTAASRCSTRSSSPSICEQFGAIEIERDTSSTRCSRRRWPTRRTSTPCRPTPARARCWTSSRAAPRYERRIAGASSPEGRLLSGIDNFRAGDRAALSSERRVSSSKRANRKEIRHSRTGKRSPARGFAMTTREASRIRIALAGEEDRTAIYRIRHRVYAQELGQHPPRRGGVALRPARRLEPLHHRLLQRRAPRVRQPHAAGEPKLLDRQVLQPRGAALLIRSAAVRGPPLDRGRAAPRPRGGGAADVCDVSLDRSPRGPGGRRHRSPGKFSASTARQASSPSGGRQRAEPFTTSC